MSKREEKHLQNLIDRHLKGLTSEKEDQQLFSYFESFQNDREWKSALGDKEVVRDRMLEKIRVAIQTSESKSLTDKTGKRQIQVKRLSHRAGWYRYAAAAVLIGFILFAGLQYMNTAADPEFSRDAEAVVNTGTKEEPVTSDEVILTLDDGSKVTLEEDHVYQSAYASGNGTSIQYASSGNGLAPKNGMIYNEISVPRGKHFSLTLSDGTKLWVNSDSRIKFPVQFIPGEDRVVDLSYGEAYMEVSPAELHQGASFILKTREQELTVIGTAFNVRAYREDPGITTTLVEGKISVKVNNEQHFLRPSDQLIFNRDAKRVSAHKVDPYDFISWKNGVFSFNGMPLEDVMESLSRWYDVEVVFVNGALRKEEFSGVIRNTKKLDQIITILQAAYENITYESTTRTIYIK